MRELPKVALLVETARGFGRDLLSGIARYSRLHGPWSLSYHAGRLQAGVPKIKQWGGTGIIARIPDKRCGAGNLEAGVPTIALGLSDEQLSPSNPLSKLLKSAPIRLKSRTWLPSTCWSDSL